MAPSTSSTKRLQGFGDGGAVPELHYSRYPLDMGRKIDGRNTLPVTVDEYGEVRYDAIVRHGEKAKKIVYCQYKNLVPKFVKDNDKDHDEDWDVEEKQKLIEETTRKTKAALQKIIEVDIQSQESKFIKYKPCQQYNSGVKKRIIRMVEKAVDPIEPPKFKHKKVPRASGSPPVPVLHSPPRPVTLKDQQDWKIPRCISNWKNPNGYTIPLDKRLAADGRGLQEVRVNDNLAKLSEVLYVVDEKAKVAVAMRSKVQKEMMMKEKEKKEMELLELARKARSERAAGPMNESRLQREKIREERRGKRRLEAAKDAAAMGGKKRKITRDGDRDISEKLALGMASTSRGGEIMMYDQRLFNQEKGMDSGFATDDAYNIYDKGLFPAQPTVSTLYRPKKDVDSDMYGGADEQQLEKIIKTDGFKPDKAFVGTSTERAGPRDDPFGLDKLWTEVKNNMANDGSSGTM
ncbi:SNW/SKI-interacting protein A-like [Lycium ferocissimum]|uniref:SNW/SKI-interacting protein A-like n=1 Tax=Lycium ferocissimum TaxID=112874 RepID=UPI00281668F4|nr:SNW/SKI-interacting protein A-like [Lycium ferocissimum]